MAAMAELPRFNLRLPIVINISLGGLALNHFTYPISRFEL